MGSGFMGDGASCMPAAVVEEVGDSCCIAEKTVRETILLVEDEAFVREVTCEVLQGAGYRVLSARDSAEAERRYATDCNINLLITDMILPGENGRVLAEKLRKRDGNLKVLVVSGYAEQIGLLNEDAVACLAKPFSSRALLESVRRVLDAQDIGEVVRICREWAHVAQT
jgi:two-component system, cell cycle sensor histidine kinase and response regulator CckA